MIALAAEPTYELAERTKQLWHPAMKIQELAAGLRTSDLPSSDPTAAMPPSVIRHRPGNRLDREHTGNVDPTSCYQSKLDLFPDSTADASRTVEALGTSG